MDQNALRNLARLKLVARRQFGLDVDIQRIVADRAYAREILDRVEQSEDEDTLVLALSIGSELGMLSGAAAQPAAPAGPVETVVAQQPAAPKKYVGGVRG